MSTHRVYGVLGIFALVLVLACAASKVEAQENSTHAITTPSSGDAGSSSDPDATLPASGNSVAAFLRGAESQCEDDRQCHEIQRALRDMLEKSPAALRQARYEDYQGHANAWSITELLNRYFVADLLKTVDEQRFFQDYREPAAQAAIRQQLDDIDRALR
jgi:hypothetical protein